MLSAMMAAGEIQKPPRASGPFRYSAELREAMHRIKTGARMVDLSPAQQALFREYNREHSRQTKARAREKREAERRKVCSVPGCGRPHTRHGPYGMCSAHAMRAWTLGIKDPLDLRLRAPVRPRNPEPGRCSIPGCDRETRAKGLCVVHYRRQRRGLNMEKPPPERVACSVEGCDRDADSRGLCSRHWRRYERTGTTDLLPRKREAGATGTRPCTICGKPTVALGLCWRHYQQQRRAKKKVACATFSD